MVSSLLLSIKGRVWAGGGRPRSAGHLSGSVGLNGFSDPVAISADVGVDAWLLLGSAGDVTP